MNKRIEQLANKAGITIVEHPFDDATQSWNDSMEKFAKIIVSECAGIYDMIDNGNLHMGTADYLEALHKTFRS